MAANATTPMPGGATRTPEDNTTRLATLPEASVSERLAPSRRRLEESPRDLAAATRLAREYLILANRHGDPRFAGRARAVLRPWWDQASPPSSVLYLRARYHQHRHDFTGALADLDRLLERAPDDANGWLLRASIQRTTGDLEAAARSCRRLQALGTGLWGLACQLDVDALRGNLAAARRGLTDALQRDTATPAQRTWLRTLAGATALQAGEPDVAVRWLRTADATAQTTDAYRLGLHADALLRTGDAAQARALLRSQTDNDALLLRLAIAERRLGNPVWREHRDTLVARFAAAERRGDGIHWRERARTALDLTDEPRTALHAAERNWQQQRELADARLLVRAALAAGQPAAAAPVRRWVRHHGVQDRYLQENLASVVAETRP